MDAEQVKLIAKRSTDLDYGGDWLAQKVLGVGKNSKNNGESDA